MSLLLTLQIVFLPFFTTDAAAELYGHNEPFLSADGIHDGIEKNASILSL